MTSSGLNWKTLGFQMYATTPWNFWLSYQEYLRNVHKLSAAQWYVEFSGAPLLLTDNPFDYQGNLTREINGNYTVKVYAKAVNSLYSAPPPEDILLIASAEGTTPNGVMEAVDNNLTPRLEAVKQTIFTTLAKNEEARWLLKQSAAQAAATAAAAAQSANASYLQAEADRIAALNARDEQTRKAMQAANAQSGASASVKAFLNLYYPLPTDWTYLISESNTGSGSLWSIFANAVYKGVGKDRPDVPAGSVALDANMYGSDPVVIWAKLAAAFPTASTSKPVFILTVQRCRTEDALAEPAVQDSDLGDPPPTTGISVPTVVIDNKNQGVSSDGIAPWDTQPDVVPFDEQIPEVTGTQYGSGFTESVKSTPGGLIIPDGFLDWLNLKIPDPAQVRLIRLDPTLTEPYVIMFKEQQQALAAYTRPIVVDDRSIDQDWMMHEATLYDDPGKPVFCAPQYGVGTLPVKDGLGSTYVQEPPKNLATIVAGEQVADQGDASSKMQQGALTDFYTMLASQYAGTLARILTIPAARAELNDLIENDKPNKVGQFLKDFLDSRYSVTVSTTPDTDQADQPDKLDLAGKPQEKDNTMLWVGLGVLVAFSLFYSRKASA